MTFSTYVALCARTGCGASQENHAHGVDPHPCVETGCPDFIFPALPNCHRCRKPPEQHAALEPHPLILDPGKCAFYALPPTTAEYEGGGGSFGGGGASGNW